MTHPPCLLAHAKAASGSLRLHIVSAKESSRPRSRPLKLPSRAASICSLPWSPFTKASHASIFSIGSSVKKMPAARSETSSAVNWLIALAPSKDELITGRSAADPGEIAPGPDLERVRAVPVGAMRPLLELLETSSPSRSPDDCEPDKYKPAQKAAAMQTEKTPAIIKVFFFMN